MSEPKKRDMMLGEAAEIIEYMLGRGEYAKRFGESPYPVIIGYPDIEKGREALEIALKAIQQKKSFCRLLVDPTDPTQNRPCIQPFGECVDCPIHKYTHDEMSDEEIVKILIDLGWEELLVPDYKERLDKCFKRKQRKQGGRCRENK